MPDLITITEFTKRLAKLKLKRFQSLTEFRTDFNQFTIDLIDLDNNDSILINSLEEAAVFFNLLTEDDFITNDPQKLNETKAVISRYTSRLNSILINWRREIDERNNL